MHRDLGYFITGILIIYAISGIALNHRKDWNPDYRQVTEKIWVEKGRVGPFSKAEIETVLAQFETEPVYKKHFVSKEGIVKVFIEGGMVVYDPQEGLAEMELLIRRPIFYHINKLHMAASNKTWIWVSDVMSVLLIFVGVSGLFLLKGKTGIMGRGLWFTLAGFIVPLIFLIFYIT